MRNIDLDDLTEADLQRLVNDAVPEGRQLEYKQALWAETGCVALAGDASPAAMLPLLHALVIDPAKRAQLGQLGQDVYRRRFSFEKLLAVLLEQYHKD